MSKNYEEKRVYYIPAFVEQIQEFGNYPVKVSFRICEERLAVQFEDLPNLLLTAEEVAKDFLYDSIRDEVIAENRKLKAKVAILQKDNDRLTTWYREAKRTASEAAKANDELKSRNAELEALLKEVTATRDEAIRQNNVLLAEIKKLKYDFNEWKDTADERIVAVQILTAERDNLKAGLDQRDNDFWAMKKDRDTLLAENEKLKQELKDAEASYDVEADPSIKRKNRVTTMEEVIVALVEKIQRLEAELAEEREKNNG